MVIDIWVAVAVVVVGLVLEKESGIEMTLEGKIINREEERGVDHGREIEEETKRQRKKKKKKKYVLLSEREN